VCFETRGVVLGNLRGVELVQDAGSVINMGGKENGGVGGKIRYIYSSYWDIFVQLVLLVQTHKTAQPSSTTITRHIMNEMP